ncbi:hypothetical protein [Leptothermofonsia sp. ETS-13]|uniref:hypothetical protein n=1 Tax=Leptothermofonsia sp. ETS-13 TaxID=3035696 RepID=UPI003BA004C8
MGLTVLGQLDQACKQANPCCSKARITLQTVLDTTTDRDGNVSGLDTSSPSQQDLAAPQGKSIFAA